MDIRTEPPEPDEVFYTAIHMRGAWNLKFHHENLRVEDTAVFKEWIFRQVVEENRKIFQQEKRNYGAASEAAHFRLDAILVDNDVLFVRIYANGKSKYNGSVVCKMPADKASLEQMGFVVYPHSLSEEDATAIIFS